MKKKILIILLLIIILIILACIFSKKIIYYYYDKKYDNMETIEKSLAYNKEANLIEENSISLNNMNIVLSNFEYTDKNELNIEFKFSHNTQLNSVGYLLRLYDENYFFGDYFIGQTSLSSTEWIMNQKSFCKQTYNDIEKDILLFSKNFQHENILEENTMIHRISFSLPEEIIIKDNLNIVLFDLNYQNVGDKNFYNLTDKLSEIKYTLNNI